MDPDEQERLTARLAGELARASEEEEVEVGYGARNLIKGASGTYFC